MIKLINIIFFFSIIVFQHQKADADDIIVVFLSENKKQIEDKTISVISCFQSNSLVLDSVKRQYQHVAQMQNSVIDNFRFIAMMGRHASRKSYLPEIKELREQSQSLLSYCYRLLPEYYDNNDSIYYITKYNKINYQFQPRRNLSNHQYIYLQEALKEGKLHDWSYLVSQSQYLPEENLTNDVVVKNGKKHLDKKLDLSVKTNKDKYYYFSDTIDHTILPNQVGAALASALGYYLASYDNNYHLLSVNQIYQNTEINPNSLASNVYLIDALEFAKHKGVMFESDWQLKLNTDIGDWDDNKVRRIFIHDYKLLYDFRMYQSDKALDLVKIGLNCFGPLLAEVQFFDNALYPNTTGIILEGENDTAYEFSECIVIIGYDDQKNLIKFKYSKGNKWGHNGYGYFTYEYAKKHINYMYAIIYGNSKKNQASLIPQYSDDQISKK